MAKAAKKAGAKKKTAAKKAVRKAVAKKAVRKKVVKKAVRRAVVKKAVRKAVVRRPCAEAWPRRRRAQEGRLGNVSRILGDAAANLIVSRICGPADRAWLRRTSQA